MIQITEIKTDVIFTFRRIPLPNNYLYASIKQYGVKIPLLLDKDNQFVDGLARYWTAKLLGISELPVEYPTTNFRVLPLSDIAVNETYKLREAYDAGTTLFIMMESIKRHGILVPIHLKKNNILEDGLLRYTAAQSLGLTEVPVTYVKE